MVSWFVSVCVCVCVCVRVKELVSTWDHHGFGHVPLITIILVCVSVSEWNAQQQHGQTTPALTSSCSRVVLPGLAADSGDEFWQDRWGTHMSLPQCQLCHHWLSAAESWWDHGETAVSKCSQCYLKYNMVMPDDFFVFFFFFFFFFKKNIYFC